MVTFVFFSASTFSTSKTGPAGGGGAAGAESLETGAAIGAAAGPGAGSAVGLLDTAAGIIVTRGISGGSGTTATLIATPCAARLAAIQARTRRVANKPPTRRPTITATPKIQPSQGRSGATTG